MAWMGQYTCVTTVNVHLDCGAVPPRAPLELWLLWEEMTLTCMFHGRRTIRNPDSRTPTT